MFTDAQRDTLKRLMRGVFLDRAKPQARNWVVTRPMELEPTRSAATAGRYRSPAVKALRARAILTATRRVAFATSGGNRWLERGNWCAVREPRRRCGSAPEQDFQRGGFSSYLGCRRNAELVSGDRRDDGNFLRAGRGEECGAERGLGRGGRWVDRRSEDYSNEAEEIHISAVKALGMLGLAQSIVRVPADSQGRMRADLLPANCRAHDRQRKQGT